MEQSGFAVSRKGASGDGTELQESGGWVVVFGGHELVAVIARTAFSFSPIVQRFTSLAFLASMTFAAALWLGVASQKRPNMARRSAAHARIQSECEGRRRPKAHPGVLFWGSREPLRPRAKHPPVASGTPGIQGGPAPARDGQ